MIGDGLRIFAGQETFQELKDTIAQLEVKIQRIYEIFDVQIEDDPASCINMVEYYQKLWTSWQVNGRRKEALSKFANYDNWDYNGTPLRWIWCGEHPINLATIEAFDQHPDE